MTSELIWIGFPHDLPAEFGELINAEQAKDDRGLPADDLAFTYARADGTQAYVVWVPRSRQRTVAQAGREFWEAMAAGKGGPYPQGAA